jgi:prepilin-type N-terminal cleavage/methylation domain-containing protein
MKTQISNLKFQKGFTLIELIVVFTVMAILATIGTASLVSYSRTQTLNQATSDLVQTLNTAKSLSASQVKTINKNNSGSKGCITNDQILNGYGVMFSVDQSNPSLKKYSYSLYVQCIGSNGTPLPIVADSLWWIKLPNDVAITSTTNMTVFFPVLSGGIITTGGNSIVLKSTYGGILSKTINLRNGYINTTSP